MSKIRIIDTRADLADPKFSGIYEHGFPSKKTHKTDINEVLERSWKSGVNKIILCGRSLDRSKSGSIQAKRDERIFCSIGCDAYYCGEFKTDIITPEEYLTALEEVVKENKSKVVAISSTMDSVNCDYNSYVSPKEEQIKALERLISLAKKLNLPLLLSCEGKAAVRDMYDVLQKDSMLKGSINIANASVEDYKKFLKLGYYIRLNARSFDTKKNIEAVEKLPLDRILLETNCPSTEISSSSLGYGLISDENLMKCSEDKEKWSPKCTVKGRSEPCQIPQVLEMTAKVKNENIDAVCEVIYQNTIDLYFSSE